MPVLLALSAAFCRKVSLLAPNAHHGLVMDTTKSDPSFFDNATCQDLCSNDLTSGVGRADVVSTTGSNREFTDRLLINSTKDVPCFRRFPANPTVSSLVCTETGHLGVSLADWGSSARTLASVPVAQSGEAPVHSS